MLSVLNEHNLSLFLLHALGDAQGARRLGKLNWQTRQQRTVVYWSGSSKTGSFAEDSLKAKQTEPLRQSENMVSARICLGDPKTSDRSRGIRGRHA